jgi:hypothetical protein
MLVWEWIARAVRVPVLATITIPGQTGTLRHTGASAILGVPFGLRRRMTDEGGFTV